MTKARMQFIADSLDELDVEYKYPSGDSALIIYDENVEQLANKMRNNGWELTESYPFKRVKNLVLRHGDIMIELKQQLAGRKNLPIRLDLTENPLPDSGTSGGDSGSTESEWSEHDRNQMLFMGGSFRDNTTHAFARIGNKIKEIKQQVDDSKRRKYQGMLDKQLRQLQSSIEDENDRIDRELEILQDDLTDKFDRLEKLQREAKKEGFEVSVNVRTIEKMLDNIREHTENKIERIKSSTKSLK